MNKRLIVLVTFLMFCGIMPAQNHWSFITNAFQYQTYVIGRAYYNGELLNSPNIEIAAFTDEGVCGDEMLYELVPSALPGEYFVYITVFSNAAGKTVTFKAYDHDTGIEYDLYECETTVVTGDGNAFGNLDTGVLTMNFSYEQPTTFGPDYPWIPTTAFGNNMGITAQIQINGVPVTTTNWEVGAFCGDECRGDAKEDNMYTVPGFQGYFMDVLFYGEDGDLINFYLYDLENNTIFQGVCNTTVTFVVDGELGDFDDPFILNFVTEQTFTKPIVAYTAGQNDHYYLIASPIGEVSPGNVTNMTSNSYDLYYFDQNGDADGKEWINYKDQNDGGFNLEPGKGYLYANSQNVDLTFTGFPYTGNGQVTLTKVDNLDFSGMNLVGNPFAQTAYIADGRDFYVMNPEGTQIIASESNAIDAMEGLFVFTTSNGETMTFTTTEPTNNGKSMLALNLTQGRSIIDRAIIRFGEERVLPKFQINMASTKLYIPMDGQDYAVVSSQGMGEMPVHFKAEKNGSYTLSFNAEEVTFSYLHLIDNLTGIDTDLLANPSYTFNASVTDYASRFKLVFATGNATEDNFVFYSNGSWIINNDGKAIVQLVDVTGRILKSEQIEGSCSLYFQAAPGVYMFRLINGNDIRVQKVVVK